MSNRDKQVGATRENYITSTVVPFTLATMLSVEVGDAVAEKIQNKLMSEFTGGEFSKINQIIKNNGDLTKEQIDALRESLTDKIIGILGPWQYLAIDIPLLSWVENSVVDLFLGDEIEAARKYAADIKLDPDFFELPCETP